MKTVDAAKVAEIFEEEKRLTTSGMAFAALTSAQDRVAHLPAADVVERKRGEWVWKHRHHGGFHRYTGVDKWGEKHTVTVDERYECDEPYCPYCGKWNESVWHNFCPNCGADMRPEGGAEG